MSNYEKAITMLKIIYDCKVIKDDFVNGNILDILNEHYSVKPFVEMNDEPVSINTNELRNLSRNFGILTKKR